MITYTYKTQQEFQAYNQGWKDKTAQTDQLLQHFISKSEVLQATINQQQKIINNFKRLLS